MVKRVSGLFLLFYAAVSCFSAGGFEEITDSASYEGINEIILENGSIFSVDIVSHNMETVTVEYTAPDNAPFTFEADIAGQKLFLEINKNFGFTPVPEGEYKIKIRVPAGCSTEIYTATGAVTASDIDADLLIDTKTGPIKLTNCTGHISLFSKTGTVYADYLEGDLDVDLDVGNLNLSSFCGQIKAGTRTGSINAVDVYLDKHSTFESNIGRIHVSLLNDPESLTIDARSKLGRIEISGETASGNLKKGSGPVKLTAVTATGSITIN